MNYLKKRGYTTCHWDELYEHLQGIKQLPKKTVMLQFDDGFLDNWTVVFPLMKALDFKFSIVVTPEFIQKHPPREFSQHTDAAHLNQWWGYLSQEELLQMHHSGLVDIQAHGFTHTWLPLSDTIIDIYDGSQLEPWLLWNDTLHVKTVWLTDNTDVAHGYPIFEYEKSLSNLRAFVPNRDFILKAIALYDANRSRAENLAHLHHFAKNYKQSADIGVYETQQQSEARLKKELLGTKEYLEALLHKKVEYLVWPGGGNSEHVRQLAFKYGYKLISKGEELNRFNSHQRMISRVAGSHPFRPKLLRPYLNVMLTQLQLWRAEGNRALILLFNVVKKIRKHLR
jgi:peptidoglycan/xylan/chitin deacetylase (PgdA/CDA1 family)